MEFAPSTEATSLELEPEFTGSDKVELLESHKAGIEGPTQEIRAQYITTPLYVRELIDSRDDELLLRETNSTPFINRDDEAPPKHLHVIETVVIRSIPWSQSTSEEYRQDALLNGKIYMRGIRIISPLLRHALKSLIIFYPGSRGFFGYDPEAVAKKTNETFAPCIGRPYRMIVHHKQELEELKSEPLEDVEKSLQERVKERNNHIECLLDYVNADLGKEYFAEYTHHQRNPPLATFEYFWVLLKPGTPVYRKDDEIWSCWIVESLQGGVEDGMRSP